jgi:hypothetical protein
MIFNLFSFYQTRTYTRKKVVPTTRPADSTDKADDEGSPGFNGAVSLLSSIEIGFIFVFHKYEADDFDNILHTNIYLVWPLFLYIFPPLSFRLVKHTPPMCFQPEPIIFTITCSYETVILFFFTFRA